MPRRVIISVLLTLAVCAWLWAEAPYTGPRPPEQNVPFLIHADSLIPTEHGVAVPELPQNETVAYRIPGPKASVRTPLAAPAWLIDARGLDVETLRLFRLETHEGYREMTFQVGSRGGAIPLRISVEPVAGTLFRIQALDTLLPGEYAFTPDGANDVYCFAVF